MKLSPSQVAIAKRLGVPLEDYAKQLKITEGGIKMKNEDIKTSRASQTRAKTTATKTWTPPSSLDAPEPPAGYRHRWIRAETMGFNDTKNVAASLREGYELVRAEDYPDQWIIQLKPQVSMRELSE